MTSETLITGVAKRVERSRFLKRGTGAIFAGLAGLLALPESALAWSGHGCNLCQAPGSCPSLTCSWCWVGNAHCHSGACRKHYCCEGYTQTGCIGNCEDGWVCSYYTGSFAASGCGGC